MVLLNLVSKYSQQFKWQPIVLHLNHGLRRTEAAKDARLVKKRAEKYGFETVLLNKNVKTEAARRKKSIEETGREIRLEFFEKVSKKYKFKKILLAHHQDDLLETVLMRLFRGTGVRGFKGMKAVSKQKSLTLCRPLLEIGKKEIRSYAKKHKIRFHEDITNLEDQYFRNKIRLKVIPFLKRELGGDVENKLLGFRNRVMESQNFLDEKAEDFFKKIWKRSRKSFYVKAKTYQKLHPAIQYATLSLVFQKLSGKTLESKEWNRVGNVIKGKVRVLNLRGNSFFLRKKDFFHLIKSF